MIFWQNISQYESSVLPSWAYPKGNMCNALRTKYGLCSTIVLTR